MDRAVHGVPRELALVPEATGGPRRRRRATRSSADGKRDARPARSWTQDQLERLLQPRLGPGRVPLADYGIRSLSKHHEEHPFAFGGSDGALRAGGSRSRRSRAGNSNWRGPIWFPTSLPADRVAAQTRQGLRADVQGAGRRPRRAGGHACTTWRARSADRLIRIFTRDAYGRRPVYGGTRKFQEDPHWRDLILFYEYFHGDNGAGLGASHQTGWTGLVASLIDEWRRPPQPSSR